MFVVLVIAHITFASLIFGVPLGSIGNAKRAMAVSPSAFRHAAANAERRELIATISSLLVLFTGLGLIFSSGGFKLAHKNIHAAMGLMVLAIVFSLVWMKSNGAKLTKAANGETIDESAAKKYLKNLRIGSGLLQTVWVVILVLMVHRPV